MRPGATSYRRNRSFCFLAIVVSLASIPPACVSFPTKEELLSAPSPHLTAELEEPRGHAKMSPPVEPHEGPGPLRVQPDWGLLVWAAVNGMFHDIEKPKHTMLEQERQLDRSR